MQCSQCKYEPTLSELQATPGQCPKCGGRLRTEPPPRVPAAAPGRKAPRRSALEQSAHPVTIVDINMPFWSMVRFMVKWVLASIPAIIILILIGVAASAFLGGLFVGATRH